MKSLLKFTVLLALVIGGKLSKTPANIPVASAPKSPSGTPIVMVNQRQFTPPASRGSNQSGRSRPQVLSVFFK